MIENRFDHVGLNVIDLDASIAFLKEMFGFEVIQRWDSPRQAFVGNDDVVLGLMEVKDYDFKKQDFASVVERVKRLKVPIVSGPKAQRDGETILFRDPSGNIFEVCYPPLRK